MPKRTLIVAAIGVSLIVPMAAMGQEKAELPPSVTVVSDGQFQAAIIKDLEDDLRTIGSTARVQRCTTVLRYVRQIGGKDTSWGAVCTLSGAMRKGSVLACDDWLVGKFTMTTSFTDSKDAVTDFIRSNCPPGG
jgi:hypothetical protein